MPRLWMLDPITGEVIRASKATAVRYEHDHPGSLIHWMYMDVKKLGRIPAGGLRAHGRAEGCVPRSGGSWSSPCAGQRVVLIMP
jgi:hypothetical protein